MVTNLVEIPELNFQISARSLAAALELPPPTDEQVAVIQAPLEPMLVVAGAGAGKTETMASRVVWLVANGFVDPDKVLGLTFTRKAAQELSGRIRRRLTMLAGSSAMVHWDPSGEIRRRIHASDPEVGTYHAYAGRLIRDYGLLLPIEPSSTLLGETELWQIAHSVVTNYTGELITSKVPLTITDAVLNLYGELAEHLVDIDQLSTAGKDLVELIDTLPPVGRQGTKPNNKLLDIQKTIRERRQLIPLVVELVSYLRSRNLLDFGSQMSLAAKLVVNHQEVVATERAAVTAVLLDEYQDTGHSQRILLATLFGTPPGAAEARGPGIAVTAVGDPIQSIYGWRGASAANLPRFTRDFLRSDGSPALRFELLTSWRNTKGALALANSISEDLRNRGVPVSVLRPRDDAIAGNLTLALTTTIHDEVAWCADAIALEYQQADEAGKPPPSAAILVRRNQDSAPLAAALAARGIPAEVVGIGGLLFVPEVQDVVAMLRIVADPMAGSAAMRLLTGPRWRIGAADLVALWDRARELAARARGEVAGAVRTSEQLAQALDAALPGESVDQAGIGDAIADPGAAQRYSVAGYRRIIELGKQIDILRRRIGQPLGELIAEVERITSVAVEAQIQARHLRGNVTGREHLDAFAEYVADFAERTHATLPALLSFLASAADIERGLAQGKVEVAEDRVQILTVHAAKGLEWDVVALVHLSQGIFPSSKVDGSWLTSVRELPGNLRGDLANDLGDGFPRLGLYQLANRKELEERLQEYRLQLAARKLDEDRRLLYVALTRTKRALYLSAHYWSEDDIKPRGPSPFFAEIKSFVDQSLLAQEELGFHIDGWAELFDDEPVNPLSDNLAGVSWPRDPLGERRDEVQLGADAVLAALAERGQPALFTPVKEAGREVVDDPAIQRWETEVELLLAERAVQTQGNIEVSLPQYLSVSSLVELSRNREQFIRRLRRPVPLPPNQLARRGTAFHIWVERRFGATRLLDIEELPGAADADYESDADQELLRENFLASEWGNRQPIEVEVPFQTTIGAQVISGRIDAVFELSPGSYTVVDWKTGALPTETHRESVDIQLAVYALAWAELSGVPIESVRAAFFYVRCGVTVEPEKLPTRENLSSLFSSEV